VLQDVTVEDTVPSLSSFTTALLESFALMVTLDIISLLILTFLHFSQVRKPILDSLGDMLVQMTKAKKAGARPGGGDLSRQGTCQSLVPGQRKLEQGVKVKRESLKTVNSIT